MSNKHTPLTPRSMLDSRPPADMFGNESEREIIARILKILIETAGESGEFRHVAYNEYVSRYGPPNPETTLLTTRLFRKLGRNRVFAAAESVAKVFNMTTWVMKGSGKPAQVNVRDKETNAYVDFIISKQKLPSRAAAVQSSVEFYAKSLGWKPEK